MTTSPRILLGLGLAALLSGCTTPPPVAAPAADTPVAPSRVYALEEVTVAPMPVLRVAPHYPRLLRKAGIQGNATVSFTVLTDGTVTDTTVTTATHEEFGEATAAALRQWKFRPATLRGVPVPCRVSQLMSFNLSID